MGIIKKFVRINRNYSNKLQQKFPDFFSAPSYKTELLNRISKAISNNNIKTVLEAGGIDRPLLKKNQGFIYDGLDIESRDKCYDVYDNFLVQSIEEPLNTQYDLIISITLLEHVPDNKASINAIYQSLNSNGETHHYVPSKWHPYSIALRMVGPTLQKRLIPILRPGTEDVTGYPAFFNHCSVPAMKQLFIQTNYKEINAQAFYRANDYFAFFTPAFILVTAFENLCAKFNFEIFASGYVISAKK